MNKFGRDLSIVIKAKYDIHDDWMCMALWYSINKYLPEAKVSIICDWKDGIVDRQLFQWTSKAGVVCFKYSDREPLNVVVNNGFLDENTLVIRSNMVCVGELTDKFFEFAKVHKVMGDSEVIYLSGIIPENFDYFMAASKYWEMTWLEFNNDSEPCTFFPYWAVKFFDINEWIKEKKSPPFDITWKFLSNDLSTMEIEILKIWKKVGILKSKFFESR